MGPTLDYARFPHIFTVIMQECDLPTQSQLRLLSSSAKLEVDTYHARYLQICTVEDSKLCVGALQAPVTLNSYLHMTTPLLSSPNGPARKGRNVEWALHTTRHVTLWDVTLGCPDLNDLVLNLSQRCTDITLYYDSDRLTGRVKPKEPFRLPASVRHFHLLLSTPLRGDVMQRKDYVEHTCATVTVTLQKGSQLFHGLWSIAGVMRPCVEKLNLILDDPSEVTPYLTIMKRGQLHPNLRIDVHLVQPADPTISRSISDKLSTLMGMKIHVQPYALGTGSTPPTATFRHTNFKLLIAQTLTERLLGSAVAMQGAASIPPPPAASP